MKFLNVKFAGQKLATPWGDFKVCDQGMIETDNEEAVVVLPTIGWMPVDANAPAPEKDPEPMKAPEPEKKPEPAKAQKPRWQRGRQ